MLELHIHSAFADDPGEEAPAATRERLKGCFPAGAARRMTTLGMLVGNAVARAQPSPGDAIVYASGYAESRALEDFIDSFPAASPTLFQTSIQPSAVQQLMIGRQTPVDELMPLSGGALLAFQALRAAALSPAQRVIVCGGEERGTWLLEHKLASERTYAFALAAAKAPGAAPLGLVRLEPRDGGGELGLSALFDALRDRRNLDCQAAAGWRLLIEWR
jgi:hypothetical protein